MMLMAAQDTHIRLHENPRPAHLERLTAQHVTTLLAAGIVNPAGPTLNAVVAAGMLSPGVTLPVVQLMLSPVSQEVKTVGEIVVAETWSPSAVVSPLFGLQYGSCPTLLLPSLLLENDSAILIYAKFLSEFAEARYVLEDVKQYFGNPWDRVSMEMRRATEGLRKTATEPKEPLVEKEAVELAELLLSERHVRPELQAFFFAWKGSIEHFARGLATMSLEKFQGVFAHLAASCRLPDFSRDQA
jgi:hypothetical protein